MTFSKSNSCCYFIHLTLLWGRGGHLLNKTSVDFQLKRLHFILYPTQFQCKKDNINLHDSIFYSAKRLEDCDMVQKEKRRPGEALKDNGGERDK